MTNIQHHKHSHCDHQLSIKNKKMGWVLLISFITMLLEITFGYITNSMALLSDGWHMTAHVIAFGAGWAAYKYLLYQKAKNIEVNTTRVLAIFGFLNAIMLTIIAVTVVFESIERFCEPVNIKYNEALLVSLIGLVVNIVSAKILHHEEEHSDQNLKAAYLHILADILTSVLALFALLAGLFFNFYKADAIVGITGSIVILLWAKSIIINAWKEIFINK